MLALLRFEWHYHTRGVAAYAVFMLFFAMGFLLASVGGYAFPGMHRNSPYMIANVASLLSLTLIFLSALLAAKSFLRERDHGIEELVYVSPVDKVDYLDARFAGVFLLGALACAMMVAGMATGHVMPWLLAEELGPFNPAPYLWTYGVLVLPNVLFCTALFSAIALLVRKRLAIYIGALLTYIFYMVGSALSNSPLLAGASPPTPEMMSLAAKLDPFGLAAFFEQTRYWTALERNTELIAFEGNLLFNRLLWMGFSLSLLVIAFYVFRFRRLSRQKVKKQKILKEVAAVIPYRRTATETGSLRHGWMAFLSFAAIDISGVIKNVFFPVILLILAVLLPVEFANAVDGGTRMPESLATTGMMVNVLTEILPFFTIIVLLFYGSEAVFRSRSVRFDMIEDSAPHTSYSPFFAKLAALSGVAFLLISAGMIAGILFQLMKGNAAIESGLYLSMYYYLGMPLSLVSTLIVFITSVVKKRFAAMAAAAVTVLLFCTGLGRLIGITHPLLRIADVIGEPYYEMNGYGGYAIAFHARMVYGLSVAVMLIMAGGMISAGGRSRFAIIRRVKGQVLLVLLSIALTGTYICYHADLSGRRKSGQAKLEWKIAYEKQFRKYQAMALPTVTDIATTVDLFPSEQRYQVKGSYRLVNNSAHAIDSLLVYFDREAQPERIVIPGAKLIRSVERFGHYWFRLESPFRAGDTLTMEFAFRSGWEPLEGHTAFNSIIGNGTFIRLSNYFPRFGYQPTNETNNEQERSKRKIQAQTPIRKFDDAAPAGYDFINLDATVSVNGNQTVIGSGNLLRKWQQHGRTFFHYKTDRPMPFRFAFSSAPYEVTRSDYHGISIEVNYDHRHKRNVDALIAATKKTLEYCEKNFGGYPFNKITYAEVSSFAEGFAATAYPGVIYVKENGGFAGDLTSGNKEDVANQLAGHELSHQWWGQQLSPDEKEGGWILTETLAQYTELMLYERAHGREKALETVRIHLDQYLANRAYSEERPLYKTHYDTPHIPYNKGMVVMHQLRLLVGEERVNRALRYLVANHAYPNRPPDSRELLSAILKFAPADTHQEINRMFTEIITCSSRLETVSKKAVSGNRCEVSFAAASERFAEDGKGKRRRIVDIDSVEIGFLFADGNTVIGSFPVRSGRVAGTVILDAIPVKAVIDPNIRTIDTFPVDNQKEF